MVDQASDTFKELMKLQDVTDAIVADMIPVMREYGVHDKTIINRVGPRVFDVLVTRFGSDAARGVHRRDSAYVPPDPIEEAQEGSQQSIPLGEATVDPNHMPKDEFAERLAEGARSIWKSVVETASTVARDVLLDTAADSLKNQKSRKEGGTSSKDL